MTSLLLSASDSVVSQNVSGCRLLGADCWDFYVTAFQHNNSTFFLGSYGSIAELPRIFVDADVLNIWTTNWSHMKNKGTKQKSKKKGNENAFGCDLIEYLQNSGQDGKLLIFLSLKSDTPSKSSKYHISSFSNV